MTTQQPGEIVLWTGECKGERSAILRGIHSRRVELVLVVYPVSAELLLSRVDGVRVMALSYFFLFRVGRCILSGRAADSTHLLLVMGRGCR